jgi:hypothetical protein
MIKQQEEAYIGFYQKSFEVQVGSIKDYQASSKNSSIRH